MFHFWIQRHDYSIAREGHKVSLRDAVEAFSNFDWESELAARDPTDIERDCPPGIGYHNGQDRGVPGALLLHICPKDAESVFFNFQHSLGVEKKLFGLVRGVKEDTKYVADFPRRRVPELIRWFLTGRIDWILDIPDAPAASATAGG